MRPKTCRRSGTFDLWRLGYRHDISHLLFKDFLNQFKTIGDECWKAFGDKIESSAITLSIH